MSCQRKGCNGLMHEIRAHDFISGLISVGMSCYNCGGVVWLGEMEENIGMTRRYVKPERDQDGRKKAVVK